MFQRELEKAIADRITLAESSNANSIAAIALDDSESAPSLNESGDAYETRKTLLVTEAGKFWLVGNSVLTECPQCAAPMTVRTWLNLADCWRCQASIQLTREQLQAIEDLLQDPEPARIANAAGASVDQELSVETEPQPTSPKRRHSFEELDRLTRESLAVGILRRGLAGIPAWLISFLLHLLLVLLLALFVFSSSVPDRSIRLSTFLSADRIEGGEVRIENPENLLMDDLRMANDMDIDDEEIRHVLKQAQKDAAEIVKDDSPIAPLPDLSEVKKNVTTDRDKLMSFAARDPRVRAEIVKKEGGTSFTEAAVSRGLRWLASVQNKDGSWSLARYDYSHLSDNEGDAAGTSLALLPFLGAGQTHEFGMYKGTVARGLKWLIEHQKRNGDLRINFDGEAGMYAHGQATIVLCEALAMTGDQRFKLPAQKAIDFIEDAQHRRGGWRYLPKEAGDTSMLGWQLMAVQSARAGNTGIEVEDSTLKLADYFLDRATYRGQKWGRNSTNNLPFGSLYTYLPGEGRPTATMTAEALLCRLYLGWERDDPRVIEAVRWLIEHNFPSKRNKNIYYWYYGTQVMHHFGGEAWEIWNRKMRELLVSGQTIKGKRAGSWSPRGYEWGSKGGRIYVTSLSICSLEVYYRHLPIFNPIELNGTVKVSK